MIEAAVTGRVGFTAVVVLMGFLIAGHLL